MTANLNGIDNYSVNVLAAMELDDAAQRLKEKFVAHDKSKQFTSHPADEPNRK